jgi:hypothetical protein
MGYAFENTPWHLVPWEEQVSIAIMNAQIRDNYPTLDERWAASFALLEVRAD